MSNDAVSEYYKLKQMVLLTTDEVQALKEREYYLKNQHLFKRCNRCGTIKHISEFYINPLKKQGVFDYCKVCARKRAKERRWKRSYHD